MTQFASTANRIVLIALAAVVLSGCAMFDVSNDQHEFVSTPDRPMTIDVIASMTDGSVLWSMDIPPYQKLKLDFDRPNEFELAKVNVDKPPHKMRWSLFSMTDGRRLDYGQEALPGVPVRMAMRLRPAPEWPPGFTPPGEEDAAPVPLETIEATKIDKPAGKADEGDKEQADGDNDAADNPDGEDNDAEK